MIFTTKNGLIQTLRDFENKEVAISTSMGIHSSMFLPESYRLDITREELSLE